jgi:hypothetical protein
MGSIEKFTKYSLAKTNSDGCKPQNMMIRLVSISFSNAPLFLCYGA